MGSASDITLFLATGKYKNKDKNLACKITQGSTTYWTGEQNLHWCLLKGTYVGSGAWLKYLAYYCVLTVNGLPSESFWVLYVVRFSIILVVHAMPFYPCLML